MSTDKTTLTSVCEITLSGPQQGIGSWSPESWSENIHGLLEDALGFPTTVDIKVRTISMEITHAG